MSNRKTDDQARFDKNPQVLQLRALEKWDGVLPKVSGGVMPFIDTKSFVDAR